MHQPCHVAISISTDIWVRMSLIFAHVSQLVECLCFVRASRDSWKWLNTPYAYAAICTVSVVGILPAADHNPGYGVVDNRWCGANRTTRLALNWLVVCYIFIYFCTLLMLLVFLIILYRLRYSGWETMKKVWAGVGGYVCLTIILWIPRIVLYRHITSNNYFVVLNIFPNISAVCYACLYILCHNSLRRFEDSMNPDNLDKRLVSGTVNETGRSSDSYNSSFQGNRESSLSVDLDL
jgi:hypothetical protein